MDSNKDCAKQAITSWDSFLRVCGLAGSFLCCCQVVSVCIITEDIMPGLLFIRLEQAGRYSVTHKDLITIIIVILLIIKIIVIPFHFNIYNILFNYYITLLYNIYFHTRRYFNHNPNVYLCEDRLTARSLVLEQFLPTADLIMLKSNSDQCK